MSCLCCRAPESRAWSCLRPRVRYCSRVASPHPGVLKLSREESVRFGVQGFLALPALLRREAVEEVRGLLDPLFERFADLPDRVARDLGAEAPGRSGSARSAEVERPTRLERRLRSTEAFARCQAVARHLAGPSARYVFDHAIYKAPFNRSETPWHKDHAYTGHRRLLRTIHFWIPLQTVTIESGCMQFMPGSHAAGMQPHRGRADGHVRAVVVEGVDRAVACPLPAGGVTIHSPLTLHYTGPNHTPEVRRAWIGPWGRLAKLHPAILLEKVTERFGGGRP